MIRFHALLRSHLIRTVTLTISLCSLTAQHIDARIIIPRELADKSKNQTDKNNSPTQATIPKNETLKNSSPTPTTLAEKQTNRSLSLTLATSPEKQIRTSFSSRRLAQKNARRLHAASTSQALPITEASLPFPIHAIAANRLNIYMGASMPGAQDHAISALSGNQKVLYGITPNKIQLDGVKNRLNPLFNAEITLLSLIKKETTFSATEHLVAITKEHPDTAYVFLNKDHDLRSVSAVPDANGAATSGIIALATGNQDTVFMATKPHEISSQFGDTGSGIAVAIFKQGAPATSFSLVDMGTTDALQAMPHRAAQNNTIQDSKDATDHITDTLKTLEHIIPDITPDITPDIISDQADIQKDIEASITAADIIPDITKTLDQIIPETTKANSITSSQKKRSKKKSSTVPKQIFFPKATPINKSISALKIGNSDLSAIVGDTAVMHWDKILQCLFVGLNVVTGNTGGRSLIVGHFKAGKLIFEPIAPESLFNDTNTQIVGTTESNTSLSIHQLTSMTTSTHLHYLIVRGGNGDSRETANTIYALPLVSSHQVAPPISMPTSESPHDTPAAPQPAPSLIGTIAAKNAPITYIKFNNNLQQQHPAKNAKEMTQSTDSAAAIGQGPLPYNWGTITNMIVNKDCVYAIVQNTTGDAGIFQSQALFDHTGAIKRWTQWQRYDGIHNNLLHMLIDTNTGILTAITNASTDNNNNNNNSRETNITRTEWSHGDTKLSAPLLATLGPVSCMRDFSPSTPGLSSISLIATAYNDQINITQTGSMNEHGLIIPVRGKHIAHKQYNDNALSHISPITDITLAYCPDRNQGFICCGGSRGVAILTNNTGNGYSKIDEGLIELDNTNNNTHNTLTFKIVGDYALVKRVVADGNYLYILTDTTLDRIELTRENTHATTDSSIPVTAIRLADTKQSIFKTDTLFFNDIVISGKLGLLATSNGLFRVGDGMNLTTATSPQDLNWTPVIISDAISHQITHLYATSSTGREQDCAQKDTDGHVYALSADRGYNKSQIYRFSLESVTDTEITATTIQPFLSDFFYTTQARMPIPSFWINLKDFCDLFVTDGTLSFYARGQENKTASYLKTVSGSLPLTIKENSGCDIPSVIRNSATGTWLIGNETGVYTLE